MYKIKSYIKTSLNVREAIEGETIEMLMERRLNNGEEITDDISKEIIYQAREEGVNPNYDIRSDKMEIAIMATDKVTRAEQTNTASKIEKRKQAIKEMNDKNKQKSDNIDESSATTLTTE